MSLNFTANKFAILFQAHQTGKCLILLVRQGGLLIFSCHVELRILICWVAVLQSEIERLRHADYPSCSSRDLQLDLRKITHDVPVPRLCTNRVFICSPCIASLFKLHIRQAMKEKKMKRTTALKKAF